MRNRNGFAFIDLVVVTAIATVFAAVSVAPFVAGGRIANERAAVNSLKVITTAQADFRSNDRDGNRTMDFWTADVFGLYGMMGITGVAITAPEDSADGSNCIKLIEPSLAAADGRTDQALYGNVEFAASIVKGAAKRGYVFRALHNQVTGAEASTMLNDTDGEKQFYGACHDLDRFGFIALPMSRMSGRAVFIVNEDNTIWSYLLPKGYAATFTGASGAGTDSTSTTAGVGLAPEFTLKAGSGQGTFPGAPARIGCSKSETPPEPDWAAVLKGATLSLSDSIDKGLKEVGEGTVVMAELESEGSQVVCAIDIAKGKEVVAAVLDLKDGKVVTKEAEATDQSGLVKGYKVTAKAAIETALKVVPGQAVGVELTKHRDHPFIWVRIWSTKGRLKIAEVDGQDGSLNGFWDR